MNEEIGKLYTAAENKHFPVMRRETAKALAALVREKKPNEILEIGTCLGVSALHMLFAYDKCRLTTVEKDETTYIRAKDTFARCEVSNRVTAINGDCNEVFGYLKGNVYDLIVLDGPKSSIPTQYEESLSLLRVGGTIFIDDVNYHDMLQSDFAPHKQRTIITALKAFKEKLKNDDRVTVTFDDTEDGFAVITKIKE